MMDNKRIVIIGATGSWGMELLEQLLKTQVAQVTAFARNEHNMVLLQQKFQDKRVRTVLGDIRDRTRLLQACTDADIVFHLAAMKHVSVCEQTPTEAIATNVIGTQNIVDCAISSQVKKVIYVSTDKAITPQCTYGCTKLLGEKLILSANKQTQETKFIIFRSGNLLASSGSVIPLFKQQIEQSQYVKLTDTRMNRFFIPIPQATKLLLEAAVKGTGGEIFLPRMHALSIHDVAKYLLAKRGFDETHITITGIRSGETLNESMLTKNEKQSLRRISENLYALIEKNTHSSTVNDLVKAANYQACSQDAILPYEQACEFLQAACI